jgi:hypothetical protein
MNWKGLIVATSLAGAAAFSAHAGTVIFTDTFNDGATSQLNWSGDTIFTSLSSFSGGTGTPSTDYVSAVNPYGITCFTATDGCVDLDGSMPVGSANPSGVLQYNTPLAAGTYTLTFELSGNQRGGGNQVTFVTLGGNNPGNVIWSSGGVKSSMPWTLETVTFSTHGGQSLDFLERPINDDMGNLLDNVTLTLISNAVPEPMTWTLMLAGFGAMGGMLRRRARLAAI